MEVTCRKKTFMFRCNFDNPCYRSSHLRCSVKKSVLRNFAKFTGNTYVKAYFNKVSGLRPATLLKRHLAQLFSCRFSEISKNSFLQNTSWKNASVVIVTIFVIDFSERLKMNKTSSK